MDQTLRNRLQRTTQAARVLLERDCTAQLEGTYDILPDGTIANKPGPHLDAGGRLVRQKLVEAVEHRIAGGQKAADAVADYSREAAFTCLNRFVAFKMLEARVLVQTCVSKGEQSGGFREFCGLAPGLSDLSDGGYQLYLESLCDELGVEVKVLFDRRDPASMLWPRRQTLTDLLALLNDPELASAWIEDETIGWVYQYFNSQEERRQMRDESAAPRNSRELAVRNQFFTPRYVVEFLTDNTLGRIWYEMTKGQTILRDFCRYLVRRPNETFLSEGQTATEQDSTVDDLPQEELLKQPYYVPHRPLKDPRDIKMLDPACGSMHFGLYAFDLFERIYSEAWEIEAALGEDVFVRSEGLESLHRTYGNKEAFLRVVPRLIIERNIHGIDIDPRCAQIAAFSLWMRAQRAYNELGLDRNHRPPIRKTNIVVAEPMPGEADMLEAFLRSLREDRLESLMRRARDIPADMRVRATKAMADSLCNLVRTVWDKMKLAGEAGSLLKIEEELSAAITKGREEWEEKLPLFRMTEYAMEGQSRETYLKFVPGEADDFWGKAEALVIHAMRDFSRRALNGTPFRRSLFAEDTEHGFAFIHLCRQRYDVILMNPPFGDPLRTVYQYLSDKAPEAKRDLLAAFVQIFRERLLPSGALGAITKREPLFTTVYEPWRNVNFHSCGRVRLLVDLGYGVLDDAMVEVAAYVVVADPTDRPLLAFSKPILQKEDDNGSSTFIDGPCYCVPQSDLRAIPGGPIAYDVATFVRRAYRNFTALAESAARTAQGLGTTDDFRFTRLRNEVPLLEIGRYPGGKDAFWIPYVKGEPAQMFLADVPVVTNWKNNGAEVKEYNRARYGSASRNVKSETLYGRCGLVFPRRTKRFTPRLLQSGCIFSVGGQSIFSDDSDPGALLGLLSSHSCNDVLQPLLGRADIDPQYEVGAIARIPIPDYSPMRKELHRAVGEILKILRREMISEETTAYFQRFPLDCANGSIDEALADFNRCRERNASEYANHLAILEQVAGSLYGCIGDRSSRAGNDVILPGSFHPETRRSIAAKMLSICVGLVVERFDLQVLVSRELSECHDVLSEPVAVSAPALLAKATFVPSDSATTEILVDDRGHPNDIEARIESAFGRIWPTDTYEAFRAVVQWLAIGSNDLRVWLRSDFFAYHLKSYTSNKRSAPIYWELTVPTHSYAVWLYYHRFTRDTFYKVLNDHVKPKLAHEEQRLTWIRTEAGATPTRSQSKELEAQVAVVAELVTFREEVEHIAPLWNPDLNDGVIINFAPLWRLVPQHKAWQKECKECWDSLVAGDYDWAHLAMHLWPERVVPECREDRSLAIAHGLESLLWVEDYGKWRALNEPAYEIESQKNRRRSKQHDQLKSELDELANGVGAKLTAAELWRKLEAGDLDDTGTALLLWPARVVGKCVEDPRLASKLHVNIPERRTKVAVEKLIKKYEDNGCGGLATVVGELVAELDTPCPNVWKLLETGALDDQALALALWPDRVVDKCAADVGLAQKHNLAQFLWYNDPWSTTWRRRASPDIEVKNEVVHRHKPAVKAALERLLSAPTPGSGTKGRRKTK